MEKIPYKFKVKDKNYTFIADRLSGKEIIKILKGQDKK